MFGRKPLQGASPESTTDGRSTTSRRFRVAVGVLVVCLGLLVGAGGMTGVASATTTGTAIDSCQPINESGSYHLNTSLTSNAAPCIGINATDVVFDGNGERIEDVSTAIRITTNASSNITVRNLTIQNAPDEGVRTAVGSSDATRNLTLRNVTMENVGTGFYVPSSSESTPRVEFAIRDSSINATNNGVSVFKTDVGRYDVELEDNYINTTEGSNGVRFALTENGTDLDLSMRGTTVESAESSVSLNLERSHATTDLELRGNDINASGDGNDYGVYLENSQTFGDINTTTDVVATNNSIESNADALFLQLKGGDGSREIEFANNTIEASDPVGDAIGYDIDTSGENTSVDFTAVDNDIDSEDGQELTLTEPNQTLAATIKRNTITKREQLSDGIRIQASSNRAPATVSVVNNTFTESGTSAQITLQRDNATLDVDVRRNTANDSLFVDHGGTDSKTDIEATNNTVNASGTAIGLKEVPNKANQSIDVAVRDNAVDGTGSSSVSSILVDASAPSSTANLSLTDNRLLNPDNDEGLWVQADEPDMTADIEIRNNTVSDGSDIGIETTVNGHNTTANVSLTNNTVDAVADAVSLFPRGNDQVLDVDVTNNDLNVTTTGSDRNGLLVGRTARNSTVAISAVNNTINSTGRGIDLDPGHDEGDEDDPVDIDLDKNVINASTEGVLIKHVGTSEQLTDRNMTISMDDNIIEAAETGVEMTIENSYGTDNVTLSDNRIDVADYALSFTLDGGEMDLNLSVTNNTLTGSNFNGARLTLADSTAPGSPGTRDVTLSNNDVTAGTEGLYLTAERPGLTVNVTALDNTVTSTGSYEDGILTELSADKMTVDTNVSGNQLDADGDAIVVETFSPEMTTTLTVTDNVIASGSKAGIVLDGGDNQTATWRIRDNDVDQRGTGIELDSVQLRDTGSYDVSVRNNSVTSASTVGLAIDPETGTASRSGTVDIERNNISSDATTVQIESGPVAGIDLSNNRFDANGLGVENLNTTAGTYVNATDNYWGASDGPGSKGPYEDPVTGTLADGAGSNVTNSTAQVANVHFDPVLTSPPDLGVRAMFTVSIDSTNSPVTEGETLTVDATVTNTGTANGSQTVTLSTNGSQREATELSLNSSESQSVRLNWTTADGDDGPYTATVETADESATASVNVTTASNDGDDDTTTSSGGSSTTDEDESEEEDEIEEDPDIQETTAIEGSRVEFETPSTVRGVSFDEAASGSVEVREYDQPPTSVVESVAEVAADNSAAEDGSGGASSDGNNAESTLNVVTVADISPTDPDAEQSSATVEFEVDREAFDDPANAVVFHETDDGWTEVETTVEATDGETVNVAGRVDSFSLFAVAEVEGDNTRQTDDSTSSEATSDTGDASEATADREDTDSADIPAVAVGILVVISGFAATVYVLRQQSTR